MDIQYIFSILKQKSLLWIRVRIRIHIETGFKDIVDPDPDPDSDWADMLHPDLYWINPDPQPWFKSEINTVWELRFPKHAICTFTWVKENKPLV
jgi:hypothetical protein